MRHFEVPLRVHSGVQDPDQRQYFAFISKWGETICSFDRQAGRVVNEMKCAAGRRFFGHAVWDKPANGFWVSENDDTTGKGYLVLRNHNLEVMREIESHGAYPHEVKMPEPGILQVANTGDLKSAPGCLVWIRTVDGKVIKKLSFSKSKNSGPSHFLQPSWRPEEYFAGGITAETEQPSAVWRIRGDQIFPVEVRPSDKSLFTGEVVSWAESPGSHKVFWTHAKARAVFSLKLNSLEPAQLEMPLYPHGMMADGDSIFVTKNNAVVKWDEKRLHRTVAKGPRLGSASWGAHLMKALV